MKTIILSIRFTILSCLVTLGVSAQTPEKFTYQAVIRNNSGVLVSNSTIGVKVSILQGSVSGTTIFSETHSILSNENGLITFEIGNGTTTLGSISSIDWSQGGPYFIKNEHDLNGGTNYTLIGTSELLSVPYALYAANGIPTSSNGATLRNEQGAWVADSTIFNNGSYVGVNNINQIGSSTFDVTKATSSNEYGGMYVNTTDPNGKPFYGFATDGVGRTWFEVRGTSNDLVYYNGSSNILTISGDDRIGINNTDPQYTLDINGTMRLNTGTNATNKVLVGNSANGEANWSEIGDAQIENMERSIFVSSESFGENDGFTTVTRSTYGYQFLNNFNEGVAANLNLPSDWDGTPISIDIYFSKSSANSGTAGFFMRAAGIQTGENYNNDPGATLSPLVNVSSLSGTLYKQTFTISNVSLTDDFLRIYSIQRDTANTFTDMIQFIGIKLRYTAKR